METATRPQPPNTSEGCYVCGDGLNEILVSKLVSGASVALCSKHQNVTSVLSKPFQWVK
jgi:hypothetical protein